MKIAESEEFTTNSDSSALDTWNFIDEYSIFFVDYIRNKYNIASNFKNPLQGLKIIVAVGNGAGGFFVAKVLDLLGADISGSQFQELDGNFPNH